MCFWTRRPNCDDWMTRATALRLAAATTLQELRMAARERTQVRMGARGGAASTFPQPAADADVAPPSAPPLKQFAAGDGVAEEEGATEASASEAPAPPAPPPGPPEYPLHKSTELGVQATAIKQDMSTRKGIKTYQGHWRAYVAWYQAKYHQAIPRCPYTTLPWITREIGTHYISWMGAAQKASPQVCVATLPTC